MIQRSAVTPEQNLEISVEGASKHGWLAIDVLSRLRFARRVGGYELAGDGPHPGRVVTPDLRETASGVRTYHLEVAVSGSVAALVEAAVVMALSGPWIRVDVGDAEFRPVVDFGCSVTIQPSISKSSKEKGGRRDLRQVPIAIDAPPWTPRIPHNPSSLIIIIPNKQNTVSSIQPRLPIILIRPLGPIPAKEIPVHVKASSDRSHVNKPLLLVRNCIQTRVLWDPERPPRSITAGEPRLIITIILIALLVCNAAAGSGCPVESEVWTARLAARDAHLVVEVAFTSLGPHAVLDTDHGFDERGGGEDPAGFAAALILFTC
jgi:hypothetical protein